MDVIYTDFQKAFDKVPHNRLWAKMKVMLWYGLQISFNTGNKDTIKQLTFQVEELSSEFSKGSSTWNVNSAALLMDTSWPSECVPSFFYFILNFQHLELRDFQARIKDLFPTGVILSKYLFWTLPEMTFIPNFPSLWLSAHYQIMEITSDRWRQASQMTSSPPRLPVRPFSMNSVPALLGHSVLQHWSVIDH